MNLLNQDINKLTFDDIVNYCTTEQEPEGTQLDYKRELPKGKTLSTLIAAFSNMRGGMIILGVEEDKVLGTPIKWDGIMVSAKDIESIHQMISNVDPLPEFVVCKTNEVFGKSFVLIRIYEGWRTPYYVFNDANVWVRTGSIKKPIDIASPEMLELLFGKKDKAEKLRNIYLDEAKELFEGSFFRARNIAIESQLNFVPLIVSIQPFYPCKSFVTPSEINENITDILSGKFPCNNIEKISKGVMQFKYSTDRNIEFLQICSNGVFHLIRNLCQIDEHGASIMIKELIIILIRTLKVSLRLYEFIGYNDGVFIQIQLKNLFGVKTGFEPFFSDFQKLPKNNYLWSFQTDVCNLSDADDFLYDFFEQICWSLNLVPFTKEEVRVWWNKN
jgi:hypothetical protein